MKKIITAIILVLVFSTLAFGVNTVTLSNNKNTITITVLDADYTASTDSTTAPALHGGYLYIYAIQFIPHATDNRMVINDGRVDDDVIFDTGPVADVYDARIVYFNPPLKANPVIDITDITGTMTNAKVIIYIKPPRP